MYTLQFSWLWPNLPALLNGALVPVILTVAVCLVGSMIGTAERAKSINFTNPYGANALVVAGRSNIEVKDATGLAGKSIAVVRGTIQDTDLTQIAPKAATIRRYEDDVTAATAILSGQVDFIATGQQIAKTIIELDPSKSLEEKIIIRVSPFSIGLRRGDADFLPPGRCGLPASAKHLALYTPAQRRPRCDP